ncbi:hypothetical protein [Parabacteroides sp. CH2-D42-20]|uniref:hypothetical protein n=1 Tax=Parabacteroides sp. CH2-D42-20 TaxID=2320086 RepID=UPI001F339E73|nr:hypothetical protein [Parabacteroides sp. CH2-D42-20]
MIRHLLQLIWNQRKQNAWLWAELLLVSVFLWFLVDYLYVMGRTYTAPLGFDIRHTYSIVISSLSERSPDYIPKEKRERPDGVHLLTALDRIRTYPGVESACLTDGGCLIIWEAVTSFGGLIRCRCPAAMLSSPRSSSTCSVSMIRTARRLP